LAIANRVYQIEAVKLRRGAVFEKNFRKALLVQATGSGKTRVAISLCDRPPARRMGQEDPLSVRSTANYGKQADSAFKEYLPGEPRVIVRQHNLEATETSVFISPPTRR
jgi:type I restriction enzyme R subunit